MAIVNISHFILWIQSSFRRTEITLSTEQKNCLEEFSSLVCLHGMDLNHLLEDTSWYIL